MHIQFEFATVKQCDFIGRTITGVCAVVVDNNGKVLFRSKPSVKRIGPREEAKSFIAAMKGA